jgi:cell division protein FtsI (penicillin-binding protein 3)
VSTVAQIKEGREALPLTRFRVRLLLLGLSTALGVLAVSARLAFLTIVARDELQARGELQYQQPLKLDARRGEIRDRDGRELALSVEAESVYAVPTAFSAAEIQTLAPDLARCLEMSKSRVAARLHGTKSFVWLSRKANPENVRCLRALNLAGIGFLDESRRFYPKRRLAAQVLGYVGIDNEGMGGVEWALEDTIRGEPGRRIIWTDALKRRAGSRVEARSIPGRSIFLTLDENLQYIAEAELQTAVQESRSKSGIAIVMRPHTGEILAMAAFPSFNPNRFGDAPESHRRNRAVTDVYEPGSTFKIVAASAALQEGVTTEDERIDCGGGSIRVADRVIRDSRAHDVLPFREVVSKSSNVGMIRIGQRLGKDRLEAYVKAFGFGEATGVELPAESRGILRPAESWGPVTAASITFGQEISVTPLQMVSALNVLATTGYLMKPRIVLGFVGDDEKLVRTLEPEPVRRVIDDKTAARVTALLVQVVESGTGQKAAVPGYVVAGKTGTAQKAIAGGYSKTDFIASFVGFAPASRPELTALVILDSPEGDHSGSRAAAVFSRIVERSLFYLGVPRDDEAVVRLAKVWPQTRPILGAPGLEPRPRAFSGIENASFQETPRGGEAAAEEPSVAPDVVGLPARDALVRFVASGLVPEIVGTGLVSEQAPPPGERLEPGGRARLFLGEGPTRRRDGEPAPLAPPFGKEPAVRLALVDRSQETR